MNKKILKILDDFKGKRILVVGDIMLDKYVWGNVTRISPEAPVQIVNVEKESFIPGGAANTANNVSALQGGAFIAGIIGEDYANRFLIDELKKRGIKVEGVVKDPKKPTIQKVRVMAQNQQLLRIDYEDNSKITKEVEEKIIEFIDKIASDIDIILISDYLKGIVTKELVESINKIAKRDGKKVVVDPKPANMGFYKNVDLITPNQKEACEMLKLEPKNHKDDPAIEKIGVDLMKSLNCNVLITRGERGMTLFEKNGDITHTPTHVQEVYDVSGAGDTVVATVALAIAAGAELKEAAKLANYAAGIVVGKLGTATTTRQEIKMMMEDEE